MRRSASITQPMPLCWLFAFWPYPSRGIKLRWKSTGRIWSAWSSRKVGIWSRPVGNGSWRRTTKTVSVPKNARIIQMAAAARVGWGQGYSCNGTRPSIEMNDQIRTWYSSRYRRSGPPFHFQVCKGQPLCQDSDSTHRGHSSTPYKVCSSYARSACAVDGVDRRSMETLRRPHLFRYDLRLSPSTTIPCTR